MAKHLAKTEKKSRALSAVKDIRIPERKSAKKAAEKKSESRRDDSFESGIPESFNVLVKEMRSLGLNVELAAMDEVEDDDGMAQAAE